MNYVAVAGPLARDRDETSTDPRMPGSGKFRATAQTKYTQLATLNLLAPNFTISECDHLLGISVRVCIISATTSGLP